VVTGKVRPDVVNGETIERYRLSMNHKHGALSVISTRQIRTRLRSRVCVWLLHNTNKHIKP